MHQINANVAAVTEIVREALKVDADAEFTESPEDYDAHVEMYEFGYSIRVGLNEVQAGIWCAGRCEAFEAIKFDTTEGTQKGSLHHAAMEASGQIQDDIAAAV